MELYIAAKAGDLERVTLLVEQGEDKNQLVGSFYNKTTILSIAAKNGHLPVVRYLVEQGTDMEKANCIGNTPIIVACCIYQRPLGCRAVARRARCRQGEGKR